MGEGGVKKTPAVFLPYRLGLVSFWVEKGGLLEGGLPGKERSYFGCGIWGLKGCQDLQVGDIN